MSAERTLLIIKPDAVAKNAIGSILMRLEAEGFVINEMKKLRLSQEQAGQFYAVHKERPFYGELVEFMTSGPAVPTVLERDDAVAHLRQFIGET
ncbi:MAG: nucleoside-diphosphate kinase, partial [Candidatus Latescibacteria bacterium]|nr:nucleoside-diphosphate kinase [Candidatus Latescibacterota bacterium]